ncbi:MAG: TIR domain-containing protein [Acidobacteria bacterium]|nr:TIR domain-containing protein [Acidobacteriota bacterium]
MAKLQWGKDDIGYSLHVAPNSYSLSGGYQVTDFLSHLGFQRSGCSFIDSRQCYVRWMTANFDVNAFASLFDQAFRNLSEAQKDLGRCGFFFDQPEGLGYFLGGQSGDRRPDFQMRGDGHTAMSVETMKQSEDEVFQFKFSWLVSDRGKGWVIHYRPKHPPLSSELQSVFQFLGIKSFGQCPEYDFETCHWYSIAFASRGDGPFDGNADVAHSWFDAHAKHFSLGVQKLLTANAEIEKAGFSFLPFQKPTIRLNADIEKRTTRPKRATASVDPTSFDVAISFAGTERKQAERLAIILQDAGFSVFYDEFFPEYLWGKNLVDTFDEIFRKRARYCVIFVSKEYKERVWTNHERQSAQARALNEKGKEYILPIKVDDTELDGMPPTIGYVPLKKGIETIGELLIKKLNK